MKITLKKIKRELEKNHGWHNMNIEENKWLVDELIKDTLKVVNEILIKQKGMPIK
jgi:hypothetical protein